MLYHGGALIVTGLVVGATTFLVTHWALAISTHDMFIFGILIMIVGMLGGFAIAGKIYSPSVSENPVYWWQVSISSTGKSPVADLFFTFALMSYAAIMLFVWTELSRELNRALFHAHKVARTDIQQALTIKRRVSWTGIGFAFAHVLLAIVGLVPTLGGEYVAPAIDTVTFVLHTVFALTAALILMFGGMGVFTYWMPVEIFPKAFKWLSYALILLLLSLGVLWGLHETWGIGILRLTAFELAAFVIIGMWLILAVDNILDYVNFYVGDFQHELIDHASGAE